MQPKKPTPKSILDGASKADVEKLKKWANKKNEERKNYISREMLALSELGYYYGWEAIRSVINDEITLEEMHIFIEGARILQSNEVIDNAIATAAGTSTVKGSFKKLMKTYQDRMKSVK